MTRLTDRLQRELDVEKGALSDNLTELEARARAATDWRQQVSRHPLAALGIALAGGVALSMLGGAGRARGAGGTHGRSPTRDDDAGGSPDDRVPSTPHRSLLSHPLVEQFVVTLATVAASRAADLLGELVTAPTPPSRTADQPAT